jgi:hypothetical protein
MKYLIKEHPDDETRSTPKHKPKPLTHNKHPRVKSMSRLEPFPCEKILMHLTPISKRTIPLALKIGKLCCHLIERYDLNLYGLDYCFGTLLSI